MIPGNAVITCNSDSLLAHFNDLIKATVHINVRFDEVAIEEGDGYYLLLATDNDKNVESAYELSLVQDTFYEVMSDKGGVNYKLQRLCNWV